MPQRHMLRSTVIRWMISVRTFIAHTTTARRGHLVTSGIPEDTFVRTVRQDPVQRKLLYAGTETGVYVSFDDGDHWQSLQFNLPIVPITDLTIRGNDLIASTQGRAFWVLDDVSRWSRRRRRPRIPHCVCSSRVPRITEARRSRRRAGRSRV